MLSKNLTEKQKEIVLYVFFGVLTTIVAWVSYYFFRWVFIGFGIDGTTIPVILHWIVAVTFAYFTNRKWVFQSKENRAAGIFREMFMFYAGRLFTLGVMTVLMYLLIDMTGRSGGLYELLVFGFVNAVVLVLNYVISKLFVFRKGK